jgi:hypothetical protein
LLQFNRNQARFTICFKFNRNQARFAQEKSTLAQAARTKGKYETSVAAGKKDFLQLTSCQSGSDVT